MHARRRKKKGLVLTKLRLAYQQSLDKVGIKTELVLLKGVVHTYFALPGTNAVIDSIFLVEYLFT